MSDGLSFCTNCGAQNQSVNEFCTGCGARLDSGSVSQVKESPTVFADATKRGNPLKELLKSAGSVSRKNLIILVAAVLVSFVVGAGLASENVFSGIVGTRYSEKRLENEKNSPMKLATNLENQMVTTLDTKTEILMGTAGVILVARLTAAIQYSTKLERSS